jgi:two-component system cell cycle sensor histidine kinase/response regulator CckA
MPQRPEPRRPADAARLELAQLPASTPLAAAFARACELAAAATGVERVGVWLFSGDRLVLRCATVFERSAGEHSSGTILRVADFPRYFAAISIRKSVPAELATDDPRTAELTAAYFAPLHITSTLDAGIFLDDGLVGVVCLEHIGAPREWTTEDRDFAGSVADLLAVRIKGAEVAQLQSVFRTQSDRLAALDKAEALEQMAGGVAHDFRNLLTVVVGGAELLSEFQSLSDDTRTVVRDILDAARRGMGLAGELLSFAHPESHPVVLDLADVTAGFVPVLQATVGRGYQIHFARPGALGPVMIDRTQFTRVLLNLVVNARDSMGGGRIDVRLTPVRLSGDMGNHVMLEVTDQGIGMDDQTRRRALDPFFTTKAGGSGLGLAVVRQVVERAGGFVRILSAPGKGTTVRVFLPRVAAGTGGTVEMPALAELPG